MDVVYCGVGSASCYFGIVLNKEAYSTRVVLAARFEHHQSRNKEEQKTNQNEPEGHWSCTVRM